MKVVGLAVHRGGHHISKLLMILDVSPRQIGNRRQAAEISMFGGI